MSAGSASTTTFCYPVRVYYEDTDAAGVVYYANYLKFFERARTEWLRTLGVGQAATAAVDGKVFVVRAAATQYRRPARLDDLLVIRSRLTRVGRATLAFDQSCERDGELLASGQIDIGCVAMDSLRAAPMPPAIASRLRALSVPACGSGSA